MVALLRFTSTNCKHRHIGSSGGSPKCLDCGALVYQDGDECDTCRRSGGVKMYSPLHARWECTECVEAEPKHEVTEHRGMWLTPEHPGWRTDVPYSLWRGRGRLNRLRIWLARRLLRGVLTVVDSASSLTFTHGDTEVLLDEADLHFTHDGTDGD